MSDEKLIARLRAENQLLSDLLSISQRELLSCCVVSALIGALTVACVWILCSQ